MSGVGAGSARTRTTQRRCWPSLRVAVQGTSAAVSASRGSNAVRMASMVWRRSSIWAGSMKSAMERMPTTSAARYPSICSAPAEKKVTVPAGSTPMMALPVAARSRVSRRSRA